FPFASKMDLTSQIPALKKNSIKYAEFAKKQVKDLINPKMLSESIKKTVNNFQTSVLYSKGNQLTLKPLPREAQLSPVFAIEARDLDGDGNLDILLGGNYYKLKPEVGRHDGFKGGYFKGRGDGNYDF